MHLRHLAHANGLVSSRCFVINSHNQVGNNLQLPPHRPFIAQPSCRAGMWGHFLVLPLLIAGHRAQGDFFFLIGRQFASTCLGSTSSALPLAVSRGRHSTWWALEHETNWLELQGVWGIFRLNVSQSAILHDKSVRLCIQNRLTVWHILIPRKKLCGYAACALHARQQHSWQHGLPRECYALATVSRID